VKRETRNARLSRTAWEKEIKSAVNVLEFDIKRCRLPMADMYVSMLHHVRIMLVGR